MCVEGEGGKYGCGGVGVHVTVCVCLEAWSEGVGQVVCQSGSVCVGVGVCVWPTSSAMQTLTSRVIKQ